MISFFFFSKLILSSEVCFFLMMTVDAFLLFFMLDVLVGLLFKKKKKTLCYLSGSLFCDTNKTGLHALMLKTVSVFSAAATFLLKRSVLAPASLRPPPQILLNQLSVSFTSTFLI